LERATVLCLDGVIRRADLPLDLQRPSAHPQFSQGLEAPPFEGAERREPQLQPAKRTVERPDVSTLSDIERETILQAMRDADGNLSEVVRRLNIPRSTLYRRLRAYGIR
jgi:transcriptional regulator of acetoin/glycerol metabolism